eukprot:14653593-Alexandrium_andersonii.AAC.1
MSASLVGSEMCIRDRASSGRSPSRHRPRQGAHSPAGAPLRSAPAGGGAVSYTHLTLPTICSV